MNTNTTYHVLLRVTENLDDSPFNSNFIDNSRQMIMSILENELNTLGGDSENSEQLSETTTLHLKEKLTEQFNQFLSSLNLEILKECRKKESNSNKYKDLACRKIGSKQVLVDLGTDVSEIDTLTCPICFEVLKRNRVWYHPKSCSHLYHPTCFKKYVKYFNSADISCPVCRIPL